MNEETTHATFANDYRAFVPVQQVHSHLHPQPAPSALTNVGGLIFAVWFGLVMVFAVRSTARSRKFRRERALFRKQPVILQAAAACLLLVAVVNASLKNLPAILSFSATSSGIVFVDATQGDPLAEPLAFTENQELAGIALAAVSTNEAFDLSAPANAIVHEPWRRRGVARDGFWTTLDPPFPIGTNSHASVYVSSSGTLSFNRRKGSPFPRPMPDGSSIAFLAPLQTSLGIVPEANWPSIGNQQSGITNSLFWHDTTDAGAHRFTWLNALLDRDAALPLSFQAELLPDGDFICRYDFSAITNDPSSTTHYVIGAQNNGGGQTALIATDSFHCAETNHLCAAVYGLSGTDILSAPLCEVVSNTPRFTLYWKNIANLDTSTADPDGDGISSAEEALVYHTDPRNADTDGDGLSDAVEIASGTSPLDPDIDADGIPDGLDPQPAVWNDAQADADGDGIGLADELLNGLDPAVDDSIDTDGDGWEDWKEILVGTSPDDEDDIPLDIDGAARIFSVAIAPSETPTTKMTVSLGGLPMVFGPSSTTSRTLWLLEGVANPVTLYAATDCRASLTCALGSDYATFQNPHAAFQGGGSLLGGKTADSGLIAQPAIAIDPDHLCFHAREPIHAEASISPPALTGSWSWWMGCAPWSGTGNEVDLPYDEEGSQTYLGFVFLTDGVAEPRTLYNAATRCSRLDDPGWPPSETATTQWDAPRDQFHDEDPVDGEPALHGPEQETDGGAGLDLGPVVAVNNDDDGGSVTTLDLAAEDLPVADNDLVACYPMGLYDGSCCPCPEHKAEYAQTGTLLHLSPRLALWDDPCKSNAFSGTIHAAEPVYVEGLSESASPGAEKVVWQYMDDDNQTHVVTNAFTVLSQRIFADLDFDDDVDVADKALHPALSSEHGWIMPVDTNAFRRIQLRTDVDLAGLHVLTLSGGDAFRVWRSRNPAPGDTPMLVSGQSVTNGINGVSWDTSSTATLYMQSATGGVSTLTYAYIGTGTASGIVCRASLRMTAFSIRLVPDYNHDRKIASEDENQVAASNPFRFWINDDDDFGDISEDDSDVPGQGGLFDNANCDDDEVNGRSDLLDFFPVWVDLHDTLDLLPTADGAEYKLSHAGEALRFVYTGLTRAQAGNYLTTEGSTYGPSFNQDAFEADTIEVSSSGVTLSADFLDKIVADENKGILMMEAVEASTSPLVLELWKNDNKICETELPMKLSTVEDMYRWINVRDAAGGSEIRDTDTAEPDNYPDSHSNGKQFIFVHGYSVHEEAARAWAAEMFKRLYQSGSRAMFTAVTWHGNGGQLAGWIPFVGGSTPDYYSNVEHAFETASNLVSIINNSIPGTKYIAGHSLGNMVVSSAIKDWNLNVNAYFMFNAAVAMEAYDPGASNLDDIRHPDWQNYTNLHLWASEWHQLFSANDARGNLTWRGKFGTMSMGFNYYSSTEDVLDNADGEVPALGREQAWVCQEMRKGTTLIWLGPGNAEAGWGFNNDYEDLTVAEANALSDSTLQTNSFFLHFDDEDLYGTNGSAIAQQPDVWRQLLADAIPALSNPTGRNPLNTAVVQGNRNYMSHKRGIFEDGDWPRKDNEWRHSDIKNIAYPFNYSVFDKIISDGGLQ